MFYLIPGKNLITDRAQADPNPGFIDIRAQLQIPEKTYNKECPHKKQDEPKVRHRFAAEGFAQDQLLIHPIHREAQNGQKEYP